MGGAGAGVAEAEVKVAAPTSIMDMMNVPTVVVVDVDLVEEMEIRTLGIMIEAGGLEAVALGIEEDGVGALEGGGIEVRLGKVVLKDGLRLNSGTGTGKRQITVVIIRMSRMLVEAMTLHKMKMNSILLSSTRENGGCRPCLKEIFLVEDRFPVTCY